MVEFERRALKIRWGAPGPLGPGPAIGLMLIIGGALLFLDNLNVLPFETATAFWPLVLVVFGAVFVRSGNVAVRVWAIAGMVAGVLLLLGTYHILHITGAILWPLALIASGVVMLIYRMRWEKFRGRMLHFGSSSATRSAGFAKLEEYAVFSGVKRKIETPDFQGGELTSVFGGIEIDLRFAGISAPDRVAVIEANTAFGSIELRIPDIWRVVLEGTAVFGAYTDKTVPPRPEPGMLPFTLVIRGGTAFGSVEVRN